MSKASKSSKRAGGGQGATASAEGAHRKGKSRALVYAELTPEIEEIGAVEASFEPAFGDFTVPESVQGAFAAFLEERQAAGEGGEAAGELVLGRVIRLDRGYPLVCTAQGSFRAEHAIALVKGAAVRSAVGDWVALRLPQGHDKALIEHVIDRVGALSRWDGSSRGERQVLAANLDWLLVAQPLSKRAVPVDRIVRSVVLAHEGNMHVAVVLTKADRSPSAERLAEDVAAVHAAVGPDVPVLAVSCAESPEGLAHGFEAVRALIPAGGTALLLGESGAGKSTLVNALLGAAVLGVGEVRGRDDQGRHTTVARRMLKVPNAGVLVDAPGLRSLPLLDEDRGLALAFPEVSERQTSCRFRDCTHGNEPGCAVREGVRAGLVDEGRLEEYRLLAAEMLKNRRGLDPSAKASVTQ